MTNNPYKAPETLNLANDDNQENFKLILASRWMRLMASTIDVIINTVIIFQTMHALDLLHFRSAPPESQTLQHQALGIGFALLAYIVVHGYTLHSNGQTIGKLAAGIKIVRTNGKRAGFMRLLFMRTLPTSLIIFIPIIGGLICLLNVLMIFSEDRKCIHDSIADTIVIKA